MPTPRKLHAAIAELDERQAMVSPTVAVELAANGHTPRIINGISPAEHALKTQGSSMPARTRREFRIDAWWAQVWRDLGSPYRLLRLDDDQNRLAGTIARVLPTACFVAPADMNLSDHRDTKIVAEALAVGATLLLTSNAHTIKRNEINDWALEHGRAVGFEPKRVVADADGTIINWLRRDDRRDRILQAAVMACWPKVDDADADRVIANARNTFHRMATGKGGRLQQSSAHISRMLDSHDDPLSLVERTRRNLPSAVIETDRHHPTYPERPNEEWRRVPRISPPVKSWTRQPR